MDSALELLYDTISHQLAHSPEYEKGLLLWKSLSPSLDLDDAAELREYEWGYLTFLSGIRLGLELGQSLSGMWMNLS